MNINKKSIVGLIVVLIITAAVFIYWRYFYQKPEEMTKGTAIEQAGDVAEDLAEQASGGALPSINPQSNPMEDAPDVNPLSETNPFSNIRTNPF